MILRNCLLACLLPAIASAALEHVTELAPGVYAAGFSARYASANCGWVITENSAVLIDLPKGPALGESIAEIERIAGTRVRSVLFTDPQNAPGADRQWLDQHGIRTLTSLPGAVLHPYGWGTAVFLPRQRVLFAGPAAINGPPVKLTGHDTAEWIEVLRKLQELSPTHVVPGFGTFGGADILDRERRYVAEVRRQVGHQIAMGWPLERILQEVHIPSDYVVWIPSDEPSPADVRHVYSELTVPMAPFRGHPPDPADPRTHALVLLGDGPHEPRHIVEGLEPVFEATGVVPHFTVDVRALNAENLSKVKLFVILRDGVMRLDAKTHPQWMTPEQQKAVSDFTTGGGGFLVLHNSMGLYPEGPYLTVIGGHYIPHGPLERFWVEVADHDHPITRGVKAFWAADEQHWPSYDEAKVHIILKNRSDEGKMGAAGWVHEPGRGRVCYLAPGHTREALNHPEYQRLLRNAVNWCLRR